MRHENHRGHKKEYLWYKCFQVAQHLGCAHKNQTENCHDRVVQNDSYITKRFTCMGFANQSNDDKNKFYVIGSMLGAAVIFNQ